MDSQRRFPEDFGRYEYRKMNVFSEDLNQNVEIVAKDAGKNREKIIKKLAFVRESQKSPTD